MSRLQPQVQKVLKGHNVSTHEAQSILTKFLKDQKKLNQDVIDSYISDVDPYKEGEEEILGFGQEEDDAGKFEEIQRRLNGILNSISGHKTKKVPVHVMQNDDEIHHPAVEYAPPSNPEDASSKSKKEMKSLEKARRKAEEKAKKQAEKEAKKAAKAQQKAEKKAAKAEKKLAKKRKSKDGDGDSSRSAKRTKKEDE